MTTRSYIIKPFQYIFLDNDQKRKFEGMMNNITYGEIAAELESVISPPEPHLQSPTEKCYHIFTSNTLSPDLLVFHTVLMAIIFLVIITTNVCMILGLLNVNKRMTLSKKLFVCLSCSDLTTGLLTVPIQAITAVKASKASCRLIALQAFFNSSPTALTILFLLHVSFARYCTVKYTNSTICRLQKQFWKHVVLVEVLIAASCGLWYAFRASQTMHPVRHGGFILFCSLFVITALLSILVLNGRLLLTLSVHRKMTINHNINREKCRVYHRKAVKTIFILSIILIFCWLPVVISFALTAGFLFTSDERKRYYHYLIPWSYIPLVMNSGINSVIFIYRDKKIRSFLLNFCKKIDFRDSVFYSDAPYSGSVSRRRFSPLYE
uniref:G-protein coupled receptors family 1 profile domain-containing protein n=1 Tax=Clytia hemisphaerica TaxID=252671 RepID=A0A7M5WLJ5_9CNID